jgi:hypothetical protein
MLRGATPRAEEIAGTAVLRIVVSSDSRKTTATSPSKSRWRPLGDRMKMEERSTGRLGSYVGNCGRLLHLKHVTECKRKS